MNRRRQGPDTQALANMGYTVIGAWKNLAMGLSPHYVTVTPVDIETEYKPEKGPTVAHVGANPNGFFPANRAYGNTPLQEIRWYFNLKQLFRCDLTDIEPLRWRTE
jgi:hypothetical protein